MKTNSSRFIFIIFFSIWNLLQCGQCKLVKSALGSRTLVDYILNLKLETRLKIYTDNEKIPTREDIIKKYENTDLGVCFNAINQFTMSLREGKYKQMLLYSFLDFGDTGDYQGCKSLSEIATFSYINVNITKLPVDLRSGLCFPKECTQWMFDEAQNPISKALLHLIQIFGEVAQIEFVKKYNVGFEMSFILPDEWKEDQRKQKSSGALVIVIIFAIFTICVAFFSILINCKGTDDDSQPDDKHSEVEELIYDTDDFDRLSTELVSNYDNPPISQSSNNEIRLILQNKTTEVSSNYSVVNDKGVVKPKMIDRDEYEPSWFQNIMDCFSIQKNTYSLTDPIYKFEEDKDLEFIDAMRVLTMFWVLLSMSAVYILIVNCKDMYLIFGYFQTIAFAALASCLISPELFLFFIYFLGFIWMSRFYDVNNGIGPKDYLKIYIHRFLKLAPMYYLIFFFTWLVYPLLSDKPGWVYTERFNKNCEGEWPFVLSFLNNLFPWFTNALKGCFYWPYVVPNDMLIHIFFPMFVIVFKKNKIIFWVLMSIILCLGFFINAFITLKHDLRVGILTFEDYYLFSLLYNKPYTKLPIVVCGAAMGVFYLRLLEYRKSSLQQKMSTYSILYFMHNSKFFTVGCYLYSIIMLNLITLGPLSANKNGYSWRMDQNAAFFAFSRFGYVTSIITLMVVILTGKGAWVKWLLTLYIWRPLARLTFIAYLIFPLVIGAGYFATEFRLYANYTRAAISMVSNMVMTYFFSFILFIILEKPIENIKNLIYATIFNKEKFSQVTQLKRSMQKLLKEDQLLADDFKMKAI